MEPSPLPVPGPRAVASAAGVPLCTYRVQLSGQMSFAKAQLQVVPYLAALGVTDFYASPLFQARKGSEHGYDILDCNRVSADLGGEAAFQSLSASLRAHGLGLLLDIVPNHLCVADSHNAWWNDVLQFGASSRWARAFDIEWDAPAPERLGRGGPLVLPVLLEPQRQALATRKLRLLLREDGPYLIYGERLFPTHPRSWVPLVEGCLGEDAESLPGSEPLEHLLQLLRALVPPGPGAKAGHPDGAEEGPGLWRRYLGPGATPGLRGRLQAHVAALNASRLAGQSGDPLGEMLARQWYRPLYWYDGLRTLNYRRYADVSDLAALRQEDAQVFAATHALVRRLIAEGHVTGLRVDHPDGLLDPRAYLRSLRDLGAAAMAEARGHAETRRRASARAELPESGDMPARGRSATPGGEPTDGASDLYLVAEKVLSAQGQLPPDWAVHGTTGYEALHALNGLFVQTRHERAFLAMYRRTTGQPESFHSTVRHAKRQVLGSLLSSEHDALARLVVRAAPQASAAALRDRPAALRLVKRGLAEVLCTLPEGGPPVAVDAEGSAGTVLLEAVHQARRALPALPPEVFDLIARSGEDEEPEGEASSAGGTPHVRRRLHRLAAVVQAKAVEDTALYRHQALASLNEMGGDPGQFGLALPEFHHLMQRRQQHWPHGLSALSTHDTKRSGDARARLNVLSELPQAWEAAVWRWRAHNAHAKTRLTGHEAPDAHEEYLLYQALLATWPTQPTAPAEGEAYRMRLQGYARKALREARQHSNWLAPDAAYEQAVARFLDALLLPPGNPFLEDFGAFTEHIALAGACNSLSQTLIHLTMPGVPDLYQGSELWDFSLVDPDNRRPVDFARRAQLLRELETGANLDLSALAANLMAQWRDGRVKLHVIRQALRLRHARRAAFQSGAYLPLAARGSRAEHVIAFARGAAPAQGERLAHNELPAVVVVAGRFFAQLGVGKEAPLDSSLWADTRVELVNLPGATLRDVLTGARFQPQQVDGEWALPLREVLAVLPVALLEVQP